MTHDAFHTPKSAKKNIVMVIINLNTGQMCTVNYSGRPRMCNLKCPDWKKKSVIDLVNYKKNR